VGWVVQLLGICLEDSKAELVTVPQEGFMKKQGEAAAYANLLRLITRPIAGTMVE
jgi:hypothetical protein